MNEIFEVMNEPERHERGELHASSGAVAIAVEDEEHAPALHILTRALATNRDRGTQDRQHDKDAQAVCPHGSSQPGVRNPAMSRVSERQ